MLGSLSCRNDETPDLGALRVGDVDEAGELGDAVVILDPVEDGHARLAAAWPQRQRHDGLVRALGIYTSPDNATQLLTLKNYVDSLGPGTILDFTNERALYFLLRRKPPMRCFDIPMLSAYPLLNEAMLELQARPPVAVILGGDPNVATFDGVPNHDRVPELARWIDVTYPNRTQIGRFIVATQ